MKTAVEWLVEKHFGSIENCSPNFRKHIEQAKEMEKEQIMDAYWDGETNMYKHVKSGLIKITAEQYYNETFKSE